MDLPAGPRPGAGPLGLAKDAAQRRWLRGAGSLADRIKSRNSRSHPERAGYGAGIFLHRFCGRTAAHGCGALPRLRAFAAALLRRLHPPCVTCLFAAFHGFSPGNGRPRSPSAGPKRGVSGKTEKTASPFDARQERTGGCSAEFWPQKAGRRGRSVCPGQQSGAFCAFLTSSLQDRTARTGRSVHRTGSRRRGVFPSIFAPKTTRAAAPFFRVPRGNEDV